MIKGVRKKNKIEVFFKIVHYFIITMSIVDHCKIRDTILAKEGRGGRGGGPLDIYDLDHDEHQVLYDINGKETEEEKKKENSIHTTDELLQSATKLPVTYIDLYKKACESGNVVLQMKTAMEWINQMDSREFQDRLLDGTLPEFDREFIEPSIPSRIERMTNHPYQLMTEDCHRVGYYNQGYLHRDKLRYRDVDTFKKNYYREFKDLSDYYYY